MVNIFDKFVARFNLSPYQAAITKNVFWAVLGKIVMLLCSLIVGIYVARYLGDAQYGLMNYVISFVCIFEVISSFGLDGIEIREEARDKESRDIIIGTAFVLKIIFSIISIIIIFLITITQESDSLTQKMVMIYSMTVILNSFSVIRNHFTSIVCNEYVVKTEIFRSLIGSGIKIILLLFKADLIWFIVSLTFDYGLVASGYCLAYSKKIDNISLWKFDRQTARYLLAQSYPLMLSGVALIIYQKIDTVIIKNMLNDSMVGQFTVACKFVEVLLFIPTIISQTVAPVLMRIKTENEEAYQKKAQLFMNITLWTSIILSLVTSLLSYWIVKYTFGITYMMAVPILQIMSFKTIGAALSQTSGQLIIINGIQKPVVIRNVVGCIFCVVLNFLLIPRYGVIGSAIASIITVFISGWLVHLFIPLYRPLFVNQLKALLFGWKDIVHIKNLMK